MIANIQKDLDKLRNPKKAKILQRFFKTGPGEYGEGDIFLGIVVPEQRKIAKKYKDLGLKDIQELLNSKYHEHRLTGLIILTYQYKNKPKEVYDFYIKNTKNINNWDLVDVTTPNIVGEYLLNKDRSILYKLAKSKDLWERRISILATFTFIRNSDFKDSINLAEILLQDKHDLIHKAVGWMLREIGKKDQKALETFLDKHHKIMPRTMLRYSIERLEKSKRKFYMKK